MIEIRQIKPEDTYELRKEVLRKGMTLSHHFDGDLENTTFHLGLFKEGTLICLASFMKASHPYFSGNQYQLRGMATAADQQGKGYGNMLLKKADDLLMEKGTDLVWCNARVVALGFYQKNGFQAVGEEFDVPQVGPHYVMFKKMKSLG